MVFHPSVRAADRHPRPQQSEVIESLDAVTRMLYDPVRLRSACPSGFNDDVISELTEITQLCLRNGSNDGRHIDLRILVATSRGVI